MVPFILQRNLLACDPAHATCSCWDRIIRVATSGSGFFSLLLLTLRAVQLFMDDAGIRSSPSCHRTLLTPFRSSVPCGGLTGFSGHGTALETFPVRSQTPHEDVGGSDSMFIFRFSSKLSAAVPKVYASAPQGRNRP